ncbi:hypothetical protein D1BOALGB6SA_2583 [Olavius sp. associated proteobacterium Delta 1]|nr:hypothetical protein D1BOALGB6SA_2583 [Olavius sp. associated proteobacterium Delta 1]
MNITTPTDRQAGWSLPIIWILLILFIGVFYLFSWPGLACLVGVFVLTCLITLIYDLFQHGYEASSIAEVKYWFKSGETIEQVSELLARGFNLRTTSVEAEWTRIESERYTFELSKTSDGDKNQGAVYHLYIASDNYHLDEDEKPYVARKLANILKTDIHCGYLETDSSNGFSHTTQKVYKYEAGNE